MIDNSQDVIDHDYEEIMKYFFEEGQVASLYGVPLDKNNHKQMVVAAFVYGMGRALDDKFHKGGSST